MLWITPVPPDRNGGGGHVRQAYLLLALARHAHVHLVSTQPVEDDAVRRAVASLTELGVGEPAGPPGRWRRRMRDLRTATAGREPIEVSDYSAIRRALAARIPQVATGETVDTVIVEYAGLASLELGRHHRARRLLTLHNLGSVMADQEALIGPTARHRWLARRQSAVWRRWVERELAGYDTLIVVSDDDAARLRAGGSDTVVVPNGVDVDRFAPSAIPAVPRLVFTGALYTGPNREGLQWFCREVLPRVRRDRPGVELAVVGMRPTPDVTRLSNLQGVTVHPDVPDVRPFLRDARVSVVPLRIGSGSRLKILEAMAAGRPVVSTTIGMQGLAVQPGRHLMVADDPESFAAAVIRLVDDDTLAGSLTGPARELVEDQYAWPVIEQRFVDLVWPDAGEAERAIGPASAP